MDVMISTYCIEEYFEEYLNSFLFTFSIACAFLTRLQVTEMYKECALQAGAP